MPKVGDDSLQKFHKSAKWDMQQSTPMVRAAFALVCSWLVLSGHALQ